MVTVGCWERLGLRSEATGLSGDVDFCSGALWTLIETGFLSRLQFYTSFVSYHVYTDEKKRSFLYDLCDG